MNLGVHEVYFLFAYVLVDIGRNIKKTLSDNFEDRIGKLFPVTLDWTKHKK